MDYGARKYWTDVREQLALLRRRRVFDCSSSPDWKLPAYLPEMGAQAATSVWLRFC